MYGKGSKVRVCLMILVGRDVYGEELELLLIELVNLGIIFIIEMLL